MDISAKTSAIFITGNSRSGTSMVAKILGNNTSIYGFNELHFFEQVWYPEKEIKIISENEAVKLFSELISLQRQGFYADRTPEIYNDESTLFFETHKGFEYTAPAIFMEYLIYESQLHNKSVPCEQTPRNLFFTDEILSLYPNAKIVCMMRDPRDVLLSQKYKWKRKFLGHHAVPMKEVVRSWFNYHPVTISKIWNACTEKILSLNNNKNVYILNFEELIQDGEGKIRDLCNFLNINYEETMLLIPVIGSSVVNDQRGKLGIDKKRTGNFVKGLTPTEILICQKITKPFRKTFGYEDIQIKKNYFNLAIAWSSFPAKLFIALLLNISRSKNLFSSIKRRVFSKPKAAEAS